MGGQEIPDSFQLPSDTRWEVCEASPAERDMGVDSSNILFRATGPAVAEPARQRGSRSSSTDGVTRGRATRSSAQP